MKIEDIKLAFERNQKFEFALIDDIKKNGAKFQSVNANAQSLYNQTFLKYQEGLTIINETEKMIDNGLLKLKELGIEDKTFLSYKNDLTTQKNKIENIMKRLN
jgi:hypothetical protein